MLLAFVVPVADGSDNFEIVISLSDRVGQMTLAPQCLEIRGRISVYQVFEA